MKRKRVLIGLTAIVTGSFLLTGCSNNNYESRSELSTKGTVEHEIIDADTVGISINVKLPSDGRITQTFTYHSYKCEGIYISEAEAIVGVNSPDPWEHELGPEEYSCDLSLNLTGHLIGNDEENFIHGYIYDENGEFVDIVRPYLYRSEHEHDLDIADSFSDLRLDTDSDVHLLKGHTYTLRLAGYDELVSLYGESNWYKMPPSDNIF